MNKTRVIPVVVIAALVAFAGGIGVANRGDDESAAPGTPALQPTATPSTTPSSRPTETGTPSGLPSSTQE